VARESEEQPGPAQYAVHDGPRVEHEQASCFLEEVDGCTVVIAAGEIDLATSPALREVMITAVESSRHLIVDLSAVTFLDSTGLGVLLDTHKNIATTHRSMRLVGPTRSVAKVLSITRIDETIPVHPNLDTAFTAAPVRGPTDGRGLADTAVAACMPRGHAPVEADVVIEPPPGGAGE
jgi:anti-sigma B factor antagonist